MIEYLYIILMLNMHLYTPKFHVGDCVQTKFVDAEPWEAQVGLIQEIEQIGNRHYKFINGYFDFSIEYIDSSYYKVECPKK